MQFPPTHSRRAALALFAAGGLAACSGGPGRFATGPADEAPGTDYRPVPNPGFDAWVASFRNRAQGAGISEATLGRALRDVGFLPDVIERDRNQAEVQRSLQDYLALAVDDDRVSNGRAALRRHDATLSAIEARYGVEKEVVTAIWGVESRYGKRRGDIPVVSALATLAYDGRRGGFFEKQLIAALRILQNGDITVDRMTGSWAGAMGHTQFIPTSYQAYAVDFTGDGRRDIWSEDPTDALASTAAYLQNSGWRRGQLWGVEVTVPAGFDAGQAGRGRNRSVADWQAQGVRPAAGGALPDHGPAAILLPAGPSGPGFLTFRNFGVIARYNNADKYVIAVGHLADRIAGAGPLRGTFPPDAQGLTLADRKELQRRLTAAGFDTDGTDGVVGPDTIAAIEAYERANGLPVTGTATRALLQRLRG
ncbi:lytic murein transglycosylase [Psychromarinibacter sp. C21-152]|uniref:Lytic murein transglycosylase n=1 Tax=Psychromarinibacter sediminicola TaxID=3033385 RepID=A0AAE3NT46_9RHOB|nr:lytic murein transglycosylase [Psychromarinibacter sediminicola]MDF0601587.1 lytic murein transglycosylase [Psychromarinibacter sediminicola]